MGISESLVGPLPAEPGDLLWLASEANSLMGQMGRAEKGSSEELALHAEVLEHRAALAHSMPATNLDMLMLVLNTRQALWLVRSGEHLRMSEEARRYWVAEADAGLVRMQCLLEQRCGSTTENLGFDFLNGCAADRQQGLASDGEG